MKRWWTVGVLVLSVLALMPSPIAHAQTEGGVDAPTRRQEAKRVFSLGVARARGGDYDGALNAFEQAYTLLPHPVIQYNMGLAYEAKGDPVRATQALMLAIAGDPPLPERRAQLAKRTLASQQKLIARLRLKCNVEGAEIRIDGATVGNIPLDEVPVVGARRLTIEARAPGHMPVAQVVAAAPGTSSEVTLQLDLAKLLPGEVRIETKLVGAEVLIDGKRVAITPVHATLGVTPGESHRIEIRRKGYRTATDTVKVGSGLEVSVAIEPEVDHEALLTSAARLEIDVRPLDANVYVDGKLHGQRTLRLAPGPHVVTATRTGYESARYEVDVAADDITEVRYRLQPLTETRAQMIDDAHARELAGTVLAVSGATVVVAGLGLMLGARDLDRQVTQDQRALATSTGPFTGCGDNMTSFDATRCERAVADLNFDERTVTGLWVGGAVGLGLGAIAMTTGIVLLSTGKRPQAFRLPGGDDLAFSASLAVSPQGVTVRGSF